MRFEQLQIGSMANFTYIIGDEKSGEAAVVDPHGEINRVLSVAEKNGLEVTYIVNTHTHWDHVAGNEELKEKTGATVVSHPAGTAPRDRTVEEGDEFRVGNVAIRILHTPGHSPDSICLLVGSKLLTGDTLFVGECGRTDLPGGNPEAMYHSLLEVLRGLDDDLEVYPGHDYGPTPSSTLGREKETNYTLKLRTKEEFVRFMAEP